ncbi:MAG TPA: PPC domain-containing DNA-binding protein [Longilinea sp.]|nr:PPC domain-containing DNA-binding protein [Longilinea sp.]
MKTYMFRLHPGDDLLRSVVDFCRKQNLEAAVILTCVGSLRRASIRLANQPGATLYEDKFEIDSLVGTVSPDGAHIHISLSDGTGKMVGGHLMEGCLIYTTAEIAVGELEDVAFSRPIDPETTYDELVITPRK